MDDTFFPEGTRFGPFRVMRLSNGGTMGQFYEAEDTRNWQLVALKLIPQAFATDAMIRAQAHREGDADGRATNPHIVSIHKYGDIDGQFYVATRMIEGTSLRALLTDYGPLSAAEAVDVVLQIAAALDAAHARGITCHDVKPENIVVSDDHFAHLMDFGIASVFSDLAAAKSGIAVGTCSYLAPEWLVGDEVTHRADIYALACVLNECLTEAPPWQAGSGEVSIATQLHGPTSLSSALRSEWVSPALDAVIAKGMAQDPARRYRSAGEFGVAAHDALTALEQHDLGVEPQRDGAAAPQLCHSADESPPPPVLANPATEGDGGWGSPPWSEFDIGEATRSPGPSLFDLEVLAAAPPRNKQKLWAILGGVAVLVVVIVAAGLLFSDRSSPVQQMPPQATKQIVLPFNGLNFRLSPGAVAVDKFSAVYVTNQGMYGRVVKLAAGSTTPTVAQFRGLYEPQGVAVDSADAVYVSDFNNRVVMLAAGSSSQIELPFTGLNYPEGIAVDSRGCVYVADRGNNRVVALPAGSTSQIVLPFDGLNNPDGVAVDNGGNVYVTDTDNGRVVKLAVGSNSQTVLPFPRLSVPWGIAVDNASDVFVTERDANAVIELAATSAAPIALPFTGLNAPLSVALDKAGNVYVANRGDNSVLELTP